MKIKRSYSDDHQFHRYQQNRKQSPLLSNNWTQDHDTWRWKKSRFWHGEDTNMWSVNEKFIFTYNIFSFHNNWFCSITLSLVKCVPFILSRRFDNVYVYICNIYFNVFDILMFQVLLVIRQFHAVHFNGANSVHYFWSVYQRPGLCMPGLSHDKNR